MSDNVHSPAVAELFVTLPVRHSLGVNIEQSLKPFTLNGRQLADNIITVGQVNFIQPRLAAVCRK